MPLNKLDNFIKNTEGRILYVSPSDLDSTDSINNQGNSLAQPFKTLQRALLEAARFSYLKGNSNDAIEKTTILLMPGAHTIDNRPGFALKNIGGVAKVFSPGGSETAAQDTLNLKLDSNFDLEQEDNILYKFNSVNGGIVIPRGTSVVGLDLRKTKFRPKYVPNPTDATVGTSAIFRITGGCYFWQFTMFDGDEAGVVYTDDKDFSVDNRSKPIFSHHKLTCFEYADGVNNVGNYNLTDLDMYYAKLSNAYNTASGRDIDEKYPANPEGFEKQRPEWEIVGAFAADPVEISAIEAGSGGTPSNIVTVTCKTDHGFQQGTPIKIEDVSPSDYNISTTVQSVSATNKKVFTYLLPDYRKNLTTPANASAAKVTIETDTVSGASPYIFNCSLRSVYGMNGMSADGGKASGFKSMVVAQFTGISLQKDDRAFVKYNKSNRKYEGLSTTKVTASTLAAESSSTNPNTIYHLDSDAIYRSGWETGHIRIDNDAILQIVSVFAIGYNRHFSANTGGDASITNSNSNFGQLSLTATGFKKEAFAKDNKAFVTNLITPRAINGTEEDVEWYGLDVGVTTAVANTSRLYLYGFTNQDVLPGSLTQGYRVGAKRNDKIFVDFTSVTGYGISEAYVTMSDGQTSSAKEYPVISGPTLNKFSINAHSLQTGEKVIIRSNDGDLPENLEGETIYYVINMGNNNDIKLASSKADADNSEAIDVYGGTNLTILSRVSDKVSGDIGHPVQWDNTQGQWYVTAKADNEIYTTFNTVGVSTGEGAGARTESAYFKRTADSRSLDEKIYKLRVVIPKELTNAKNPESGFIIQESSTTGIRTDGDFLLNSISRVDYGYNRNPRFIGSCTYSGGTVSVRTELPHNLDAGDVVITHNIKDTTNTTGVGNSGYNGTFTVVSVPNEMEYTYTTGRVPGPALTNDLTTRDSSLPRFEVNDLQNNLYVYRNETVSDYIQNQQDGIYHIYALNADVGITTEFTDLEYSQNVTDLYPQMDRDNLDDSPESAKSFALRAPLGKVQTSDLKKSLTRASTDSFIKNFDKDLTISSESALSVVAGIATLTLTKNHNLSGIATYSTITAGSGHVNGTYYNVKLFNEVGLSSWNGATAVVGVQGGAVVSVDVQSPGSGYQAGNELFVDTAYIGGTANSKISIASSNLTGGSGNVVQVTGIGTTAGGHYRVLDIPGKNTIAIGKSVGDPFSIAGQFVVPVAPVVDVSTSSTYDSTTGNSTIVCDFAHGLVAGSRFTLTDVNNNKLGDYLVKSRVGVNTFTTLTNADLFAGSNDPKYLLKHGLSANDSISDRDVEGIAARGFSLYDNEYLKISGYNGDNKLKVTAPSSGIATTKRFPLGTYVQVDDEVMRIASSTLSGVNNDELTVIRGTLGTGIATHAVGSYINKIQSIPIEFRRPSILRASGHTFEYLGFGPGNYSTGLPQVQDRTLTETEEYLSQAQERSAGVVVYTGMNSKGDFFIGNQKKSSSTGEERTFDTPVPTVTGEDPARLSVVFDEVTIKERLVVEGGDSNEILSEFDGPVTFNNEVIAKGKFTLKGALKISDTTASTNKNSGALVVVGGVGIGGTVNLGAGSSIRLPDNAQATFGNDDDLAVFHSGTHSYIKDQGTGDLNITGSTINLKNSADSANLLVATENSSTALYYKGTKRLETSGVGVTVFDQLDCNALSVTAAATFADDLWVNGDFGVSGISTLVGEVEVRTGIVPDTDEGAYFGTASKPWSEAHIDEVRIGVSGNGEIDTATGNLTLDSTGGTVIVDDAFEVTGVSTFKSADFDGDIRCTGDITAFWSSDETLKENITPIDDPLAKVLSISGNTFTWKEGAIHSGEDTGVIAQEIEALGLPGLAVTRETGIKAVKYEKLTALLIEAVKELSAKVDSLEQKLSDK